MDAWNVSYGLWNISLATRALLSNIVKFETATVGGLTRPTNMQVLVNQVFHWSEEAVSNTDKIKLANSIDEFTTLLKTILKEGRLTNAADILEVQASISKFLEIKLKLENSITTLVPIVVDGEHLVVRGTSVGKIALSETSVWSINSPRMLPANVTSSTAIATIKNVTLSGSIGKTVDIVESGGQYYLKNGDAGDVSSSLLFNRRIQWLEELRTQYGPFNIDDFKPKGYSKSDIPSDVYSEMLLEYPITLSLADKEKYLEGLLNSGNTVPLEHTYSAGDELYKIVPKGESVSAYTPFFISKSELELLKIGDNIEQQLGLPLISHAVEYDIYKIVATQPAKTFESTIANTVEKGYTTIGGAKQILVIDRSKWGTPVKVETIIPNK